MRFLLSILISSLFILTINCKKSGKKLLEVNETNLSGTWDLYKLKKFTVQPSGDTIHHSIEFSQPGKLVWEINKDFTFRSTSTTTGSFPSEGEWFLKEYPTSYERRMHFYVNGSLDNLLDVVSVRKDELCMRSIPISSPPSFILFYFSRLK